MSTYGIGTMNQLGDAMEKVGFTADDITKMRSDISRLAEIKMVLAGTAQIVSDHTIDCDSEPQGLKSWKVEEHIPGGLLKWDPNKVALYLVSSQEDGVTVNGHKLREYLGGQRVLNANVLDYLLRNPHLIPKEWRHKKVFFWGTIARSLEEDMLAVRYLYWVGGARAGEGSWLSHHRWLDIAFTANDPAVVLIG